jgi:hypothetical protein
VLRAIDVVLEKCAKVGMPVGMAVGHDIAIMQEWISKGILWLMTGNDFTLMLHTADAVAGKIRAPKS